MKTKLSSLLTKTMIRAWPLFLILGVLSFWVSLPRTTNLFKTISTDPLDLLPSNYPNVQSLFKAREKVEIRVRASITFESDHPETTLRYLNEVVEQLRQHSMVYRVMDKKAGFEFFDRHKLLYLELADLMEIKDRIDRRIQREKLHGLLIDFEDDHDDGEFSFGDLEEKYKKRYAADEVDEHFVSKDKHLYSIFVEGKEEDTGLEVASRFHEAMKQFVLTLHPSEVDPSLKVYLAGPSKVVQYRALIKDLKIAGIISGICIFLPLLIRFRNPLVVLLIFAPLGLAIPVGLGVASLWIPKLNVSTSFLFAILGGLGIENGIHLYGRYHEIRSTGGSLGAALSEMYRTTGRSIVTSVITVSLTFLMLVVNDYRGFSDFGAIAGVSLWVILAFYFLFFPPLLILGEKFHLIRFRHPTTAKTPKFSWSPQARWRSGLLILFAVYSIYSIIAPFFVHFEYDSKYTRADIPEISIPKQKLDQTVSRINNPAVVVIQNREDGFVIKKAIDKIIEEDKLTPTIDAARSLATLVPEDQEEKMNVIHEMEEMLADPTIRLVKGEKKKDLDRFKEALHEASPIAEGDIPEEVKEIFVGKRNVPGEILYVWALPDLALGNGYNAMHFSEDVGAIHTERGDFYPSSDAVVFGKVLHTMLKDTPKVILLSLCSVAFFVFLDFRNAKKSLLVLASIVTGVFWLLGIMLLFGIRFNFYNMVMIPAIMGMSIDNAIHIYHRYEELGRGSIGRVLSTSGLSSLLSSLTNAGGFVGLLFSVHGGLYSMGLLAVLGVATCLISTLVCLPLLLHFLEHLQLRGRYRSPPETPI